MTSKHFHWLVDTGKKLQTADGRIVELWEFKHTKENEVLSSWAKHFRNHYCIDKLIDNLRKGYNYSRKQYLIEIKFPDQSIAPGPSIRAGDFSEILVADFLEYLHEYWVPRTRYGNKTIRNESTKGCDIIGFRFINEGEYSPKNELAIFEVKAQFTGNDAKTRLQDAINGSIKDITRKAESLNALKQRFVELDDLDDAEKIEKFQNEADHPYQEVYGAVALLENRLFDDDSASTADTSEHPRAEALRLIIITGDQMMPLVHELYRRAADEAEE